MPKKDSKSYDSKDIKVLEGLEAVRKRPAMYIGSTGPNGLHHLIWEVVDNSVDEAMAGRCTQIDVMLEKNGSVTVKDNGSGIPVKPHPKTKKSALTTVLTTLHAGGKFESGAYTVSGGLHGVGISVVNALSVFVKVEVERDGHVWNQNFDYGKPTSKIKKGNSFVKESYEILNSGNWQSVSKAEFIGNVEGRDLMSGAVDVVVTDGFTGNVALKTLEGTAKAIVKALYINKQMGSNKRNQEWICHKFKTYHVSK